MAKISNGVLEVEVSSKGAELQSIRKNGVEYLWQADPSFWPRKAPILFPIVGRVIENKYTVHGNQYELGQHGFARDMDFELIGHSASRVEYVLNASETSKKRYPFDFELKQGFSLEKNIIQIFQSVKNPSAETMYYSLGNHPGFRCPLSEGHFYEDYFLEFEYPEILNTYRLKDGYLSDRKVSILNGGNVLPLQHSLFKEDALIFQRTEMRSSWIALRNKHDGNGLRVRFDEFPWLGIWSKPGPFVCIEPWDGVTDRHDHSGDFTRKNAICQLKPGEQKSYSWEIELF
ncbi:MAG: aldose 1-epimerase family protein [Cytophagaceae bacterium]|jgi:galactose mutarotase-like enzyme|nr:aldose 1-epimerase family protein [Cytophagaceae bacterium]